MKRLLNIVPFLIFASSNAFSSIETIQEHCKDPLNFPETMQEWERQFNKLSQVVNYEELRGKWGKEICIRGLESSDPQLITELHACGSSSGKTAPTNFPFHLYFDLSVDSEKLLVGGQVYSCMKSDGNFDNSFDKVFELFPNLKKKAMSINKAGISCETRNYSNGTVQLRQFVKAAAGERLVLITEARLFEDGKVTASKVTAYIANLYENQCK